VAYRQRRSTVETAGMMFAASLFDREGFYGPREPR
jgi:hypothetical protein